MCAASTAADRFTDCCLPRLLLFLLLALDVCLETATATVTVGTVPTVPVPTDAAPAVPVEFVGFVGIVEFVGIAEFVGFVVFAWAEGGTMIMFSSLRSLCITPARMHSAHVSRMRAMIAEDSRSLR